jgi:predicted NAD/FAD-dependent oxidoreductase
MAAFEKPLGLPFDAAVGSGLELAWIACDSSKPGRSSELESWVLHAGPEWSAQHLEDPPEAVGPALLRAAGELLGRPLDRPSHLRAHRWRYALPLATLEEGCLVDEAGSIVVCGDWCAGPRIEGAVLSGLAAARAVGG